MAAGLAFAVGCGGTEETATIPTGPAPGLGDRADPLFPAAGNPGYDVRHYDWALDVDPETGAVELTATTDAVATDDVEAIWLDYTGPELSTVSLDGDEVTPTVRDGKLVVPGSRSRGDRFEVVAQYTGTPESRTIDGVPGRLGWIADDDGVHTVAVFPGDTASWVPLNDTPHDPATYDLSITVPAPYVATASGTLDEVRNGDGFTTFHHRIEQPVTEVTIAVDEYVVDRLDVGQPHVDVAVPEGARIRVDSFADVPRMVEFLTDLFGPFPFSTVGFTVVPDLAAEGDSTPGRINVRSTAEDLLVHELAHQWMGGIVGTASTADGWLREGLPTYMELLWLEHEGRATVAGSVSLMRDRLGGSTRVLLEPTTPRDRADDVIYERGALTLHALHSELGDVAFQEALQRFFRDHAGTSASTDDFIASVTESSGRDLDGLFDAWIRSGRMPAPPTGGESGA